MNNFLTLSLLHCSHFSIVELRPSSLRPTKANDAPCFEKRIAIAAPIPELAP
jgi:hypothetical protein